MEKDRPAPASRELSTEKNDAKEQAWWLPAIMIFLRLSGWIIFPVLAGVAVGKWLDSKLGSEPWFLFSSIGLAFCVSMFGLIRNAIRELGKMDNGQKPGKK